MADPVQRLAGNAVFLDLAGLVDKLPHGGGAFLVQTHRLLRFALAFA
jgi:hypothetical protein